MKPFLALSLMLLATTSGTARPPDVVRTVHFSAVDAKGVHVPDLTAADLAVKEGGKDRAIEAVGPASMPMKLSILIDDNGTGGFQGALSQLIQATFGQAEYTVRALSPQAIQIVGFTKDADELRDAIRRLGPRGRVESDSEQIIAGVTDAAKELLQRKARRASIVVLTAANEKAQSDMADEALRVLKNSGASLSVIYVTGVQLGLVLGDGPRRSGGIIEQVTGNGALTPSVAKLADTLRNQYMLTYTVPEGVKLNERLSLTTSRKGVKLISPNRLPDQ